MTSGSRQSPMIPAAAVHAQRKLATAPRFLRRRNQVKQGTGSYGYNAATGDYGDMGGMDF